MKFNKTLLFVGLLIICIGILFFVGKTIIKKEEKILFGRYKLELEQYG